MRKGFMKLSMGVAAVAVSGLALQAHAIVIDGSLDAGYGSALATQTVNTGFGDSAGGDSAGGSELDAGYGVVQGGNLDIFLAGNFENNGNHANVFVDGGAVGQSTLALPTTAGMSTMNGSNFSPGFQATYAFDTNDYQGTLYSEEYVYNGPGSLTGGYVGSVAETSTGMAAGTPSSGGFPAYAMLGLNNTNVSTMGASGTAANQSAVDAVTTGLELSIPLSQIGYTGGNILVLADINGGGDSYLSNQFLPGLPVGSGNVGNGGHFDFSVTPGQFFTVAVPEPATVGVIGAGMMLLSLRRRRSM
jgi:hypothetical protein